MSLQNPLKPQTAMKDNASGEYFYPMTVPSQVLMPDGRRLDACLADMNGMELLWTNASPTSAFVPQTVNFDTTRYKAFCLSFCPNASWGGVRYHHFVCNTNESIRCTSVADNNIAIFRQISIKTNGMAFTEGYHNSNTVANDRMIPCAIYGIK